MQYLIIAISVAITALAILWFCARFRGEKRSLWLGISFVAAVASFAVFIASLLLLAANDLPYVNVILVAGAVLVVLIVFLFPLALLISLVGSGIQLIRREGFSLKNVLSLGGGILYLAYLVFWPVFKGLNKPNVLDYLYLYLSFVFGLTVVLFIAYTVTNWLNLIPNRKKTYQTILVLGSGLLNGVDVSPLLAGRIDKGIAAYHENEGSVLVLSGGQGGDERRPEADAMKQYALRQGVPEESIVAEDRSTSTRENLLFSTQLLRAQARDIGNLLVVTTSYHVLRALLLAKSLGIPCDGRGAKTKFYFSLNAFIREWIAYLVLRRRAYVTVLLVVFILLLIRLVLNFVIFGGLV